MTAQPPNPQPQYQQPQYQQQPYWAPPLQPNRDDEHLKLLSIFHYVLGGLVGFFACFPFIHVGLGTLIHTGTIPPDKNGPPPEVFGWMFVIMGSFAIILGWTLATILLIAGGRLRKKRSWTFCFVVACLSCLFTPMGTVLGVFTILVLSRDTVKVAFAQVRAAG